MTTREVLRSLHIINTWDMLKRFGGPRDVACVFHGRGDFRSGQIPGTRIFSVHFDTNPEAHWMDHKQKTFSGPRTESLTSAKTWASTMYGISEWGPCPTDSNTYIPLAVRKAALQVVRLKTREGKK